MNAPIPMDVLEVVVVEDEVEFGEEKIEADEGLPVMTPIDCVPSID